MDENSSDRTSDPVLRQTSSSSTNNLNNQSENHFVIASCRRLMLFISHSFLDFEACKRRISTLSLPTEPANCSDDERSLYLRTVIDYSQTQSVHALGALLRYLDLNWAKLSMDLHGKPQFLSLRIISLVLLQHPTSDLATLEMRQELIAYFMKPQSDALMRNICSSLRYIKNVHGILTKIKALSAKPYQWKSLYNTLYNAVLICEMCESAGKVSKFLEQLACFDNSKLYEMALYMNRIIDFDLSKTEGKFTVKPGVDPELDMKKQTMASLHGLMSETAKVEMERLPPYIQECSMLYMPHLGYLLGVKVWDDNLTAEDKELPDMKFMFQNNDYIHYKSKGCEELDVLIGDTYPEIVAHETRIMMRLTAVMLHHLHTLTALVDNIKAGRHPLYMLTCDSFVPNDVESSVHAGCVKILTGPNSSGKSVYMKQIGLIVYLAHVGSFVPAESAAVGVLRHIHTRIHTTECVAAHMSAFLIDLRQMSLALQESTSNSLLIVDEFGKGTSATDGLALLAACLNTLLFRGDQCPHVLLATHYLQIKEYIVDTPIVRYLRFEYVIQDGEPVFLFRVCEGGATSSFALQVAAAAGLGPATIARAKLVMDSVMSNSLPPENKQITSKQNMCIEKVKNKLLTDI
ncbi:hypothetical protein SFRURICE_007241 [Spodoptera frugiperda]|nr:hypothetical protein SFRURICE_007241 [Spodoptera frugiperda]